MPGMKPTPGYELINRVVSAATVLVKESHRVFRPHGITEAQFNILNVLGQAPEGASQRELSDELVVDRSNVTGLLDRMEKAGWVRRDDHPKDRRIYVVTLTAAGRKLWQKVLPDYLRAVDEVTAAVDTAEMRRMGEFLKRLEATAREWGKRHES